MLVKWLAVTSQQQGSWARFPVPFLCGMCMFALCLRGFTPCAPAASYSPKICTLSLLL